MKNKTLLIILLLAGFAWLGAQLAMPENTGQIFISVNVTGFVPKPGTYQLTPLNRLSDALSLAAAYDLEVAQLSPELMTPQQVATAAQDSLYQNFQGLRDIRLLRGKDTRVCDLLRFQRLGDLEHNPLLRDGDVIVVSPMREAVSVFGEVYLPGEYQYLSGDKLSDLLDLAMGFTLNADRKAVSIYRYRDNLKDFDVIRIDLGAQAPEQIALNAHDRVMVSRDSELRRAWKVKVEGNVRTPGEFIIGENTTLYDILTLCGGPTVRGDLRNAVYASQAYSKEPDQEFERLKLLYFTQMTSMEYNYMRNKLRQFPGKYAVNVWQVWDSEGKGGNPVLRDGDYLYVPELLDMVEVSGQVAKPGLVPWIEGKTWEYYIQAAGGYTNNRRANGTRIISAASGNWLKPSKKVAINPGDRVFVAEKQEHDFWTDVKDVVTIASQLVTIFLGVRAITN